MSAATGRYRPCSALVELREADGSSRFVYCVGDQETDPHEEHAAPHPFERGCLFWRYFPTEEVAWADPEQTGHWHVYTPGMARPVAPGPCPRPRRYEEGP